MRLPRYGRDLVYDRCSAEALVPAVGVNQDGMGEVFRLSLDQGQYMRSYEVDVGGDDFTSAGGGALQGGINTGAVNTGAIAEESHNLLAFGTTIGTVELWDSRARGRAAILAPPSDSLTDGRSEITALKFHRSGLTLGTGSYQGLIHLYDLRSPVPLLKKDQGYGYPIHTIDFLMPSISSREQTSEPKVLTSDKRIIKIWDARTGAPWTSVEPAVDINCVAWYKDSGMILTANEGRQQHAFFIPQLGPAPKWCSFLDNLVEEMAEDPNDPNSFATGQTGSVYDNYKFLTVPQLRALNLDHLIGRTTLLRPYMHGYFVAQRLYEEARLIANPFAWEEERAKRVKEKIGAERESRIRGKKKITTKVNKKLAEKLLAKEELANRRHAQRVLVRGGDDMEETGNKERAAANAHTDLMSEDSDPETSSKSKSSKAPAPTLLSDPRFAKLFEDEDFAVDETSHAYQSLHSHARQHDSDGPRPERGLTAVEEEAIDQVRHSSDEESDDQDDDEDETNYRPKKPATSSSSAGRISTSSYKRSAPRMQVLSSTNNPNNATRDRSFGSRAQKAAPHNDNESAGTRNGRGMVVGEKTVTFTRPSKGKNGKSEGVSAGDGGRVEKREKERRSASGNTFRKMWV